MIEGLDSGGFSEPQNVKPQTGEPEGQLYNLATDAAETTDLDQQNPEKVKELKDLQTKIRKSKTWISD